MGTALTVEQVHPISNLASSYVLALDQDSGTSYFKKFTTSWGIFESNTSNDSFSDYSKILKFLRF